MKHLYIVLALAGASSLSADYNDGYCDEACRQRYYESRRAQGYSDQWGNQPRGQRYIDSDIDQQQYGGYSQRFNQDNQNPNYQDRLPNDQRNQRFGGYGNNNNSNLAEDDRKISDDVKGVVAGGWFSSGNKNVTFDVNNGNVTLRGTVGSLDEKNNIEQKVRNINGVRNINNQLMVQGAQPSNNQNRWGGYDNNNNQNGNPRMADDRMARPADDKQLNDKVKDVVAGGWFSSGNRNVSFDLNNGNVTLRGTVDSTDEKNKIEQDVRKIDGIRNVNNQIVVQASKPGDYSQDRWNTDQDRQLNSKIRSKLSGWFSTAYDGVILQTNNGVVILWGTVKNVDDQGKLTAEVQKIEGVRSVQNNTKVQTQ